jgi:hypothetical protein
MGTQTRNNTPANKPDPEQTAADPAPEEAKPTTVRVTASLALAGLFQRDETRTVERTPFVQNLIDNGKLVVQED